MTRRRRWLLLGVGSVAVAGVVGYLALWLSGPRHRINMESATLIEKGMTQADVEAILGVPPGDYSSGEIAWEFSEDQPPGTRVGYRLFYYKDVRPTGIMRGKEWASNECIVVVEFDSSGKVVGVSGYPVLKLPSESMLSKLRRWFRL